MMLRALFYHVITQDNKKWKEIERLQKSGKLPWNLRQIYVYTNSRQYERNVLKMEHWSMVEVKLRMGFPFCISPGYKETIKHCTCLNPLSGRLHLLLEEYRSSEDLYGILSDQHIFIPPIFSRTTK